MEDLKDSMFDSVELEGEHISIIDDIIKIQRQNGNFDAQTVITKEDRDIILKRALSTYKFLNKTIFTSKGKVLIEYRSGLYKIVEQVIL